MPTIQLTKNTGLDLTASSADDNATLNRYLLSLVTFKTPPSFDPIANLLVKDQKELDFPITLAATGDGKFAVEKSTLDVQLGASASIGLLQDSDEAGFLDGLNLPPDAASSGLVSFALQGTVGAGLSASVSDFGFGVSTSASVSLTSYYPAAADETLGDAVAHAVSALTIPHDLADLRSLRPGAICQVEAAGSLQFSASVSYEFLNNPLAAVAISSLPSLSVNATASATLEAAVTHSASHTLTIARLPNGLLHLSVSLGKTDDFATSLTVSAGIGANIGSQDALAFLLGRINPNAAAEAETVAAQMKNAAQFKADIKSAIETSLSTAVAASLQVALDTSKSRNRAFLFEINLDAMDDDARTALAAALAGDFTAITKSDAKFKGIELADSALTVTVAKTHTLALHFLGIFNAASINQFVASSTIDFTSDTHEIVLADESIQVLEDNLDAEKLRKLVLKDITLTLPASANTKDAKTPISLAFLDREGSTSPAKLRQFVNVLAYFGADSTTAAHALLARQLKSYGVCGISLGLSLDPSQCRQLFLNAGNQPYDWGFYINAICAAQLTILASPIPDPESAYRLRLFHADAATWKSLHDAGSAANMPPIFRGLGMTDIEANLAYTDAVTAIWWADAMSAYATALAKSQSLEAVGKQVVKDANLGYNEPWMILAAWNLAGKPPIRTQFSSGSL